MKPSEMFDVLNLAKTAREGGKTFIPCFSADAGMGKSEIHKQWAMRQRESDPNFGFIDIRGALLEAPDLIGLVKVAENAKGEARTFHITPGFWPEPGTNGLLFLDEVNRGKDDIMNGFMQLLTDRRIGDYVLPEGWVISAAINPDNSNYSVNTMETAFTDRFVVYDVEFDQKTFVSYIKSKNWHPNAVSFIESQWVYKSPDLVGDQGKFVSSRTWSYMNAAEHCGLQTDTNLHFVTSMSILGKVLGREYYNFTFENKPVTLDDLVKLKSKALDKLKKYSDPNNYKGDLVSVTIKSVLDGYGTVKGLTDELLCEIAVTLPTDQTCNLLQEIITKDFKLVAAEAKESGVDIDLKKVKNLAHFVKIQPKLKEVLRANLVAKEIKEKESV